MATEQSRVLATSNLLAQKLHYPRGKQTAGSKAFYLTSSILESYYFFVAAFVAAEFSFPIRNALYGPCSVAAMITSTGLAVAQ